MSVTARLPLDRRALFAGRDLQWGARVRPASFLPWRSYRPAVVHWLGVGCQGAETEPIGLFPGFEGHMGARLECRSYGVSWRVDRLVVGPCGRYFFAAQWGESELLSPIIYSVWVFEW